MNAPYLPMASETYAVGSPAWLLLRATRAWVRAILAETCSKARGRYVDEWNDVFAMMGSPLAANLWGSFMRHLGREGTARFLLGCAGCGGASVDEEILLRCLAAHQSGQKGDALQLLERWFEGTALWQADALAEAFAELVGTHGFFIQIRDEVAPDVRLGNAARDADKVFH